MKKLLFIATLLVAGVFVNAQETPKYVYAEIIGESKMMSNKVNISIDYGQASSFFEDTRIRNEDGTKKVFNSMVDAMNYMGALGWEFQQAYAVTGSYGLVYRWLLKKDFTKIENSIQEEMKKNFPTKKDLK